MPFVKNSLAVSVALVSAALVTAAPAALSEGFTLEEVVVTAQKREQSLQDVPISVAAIGGEKINDLGIQGLEELTIYTPNVTINQGQASPNMFIRGIGSGTNSGFEQSIGLYVDGIYVGRSALASTPFMLDLERVEILKGPQGILFGKNTIGGAINVTSAKPTAEFEGFMDLLYEPEHGEQVLSGVVSGPLTESVAGRVAVRHAQMDGWVENTGLDQQGPDNNEDFIRASLLWDSAEGLEVIAKYEYGSFKRNGSSAQILSVPDGTFNDSGTEVWPDADFDGYSNTNFPFSKNTRTETFSLTLNQELGENTLTSITGYSAYGQGWSEDADHSPVSALHRNTQEDFQQYSQEVRLVSPGGETLDWIVGGYWQTNDLSVDRENLVTDFIQLGSTNLAIPPLALTHGQSLTEFEQTSESWALFGQGTWNINETVRVSLGLRYGEEEKQVDKRNYFTDGVGVGVFMGGDRYVYGDPKSMPYFDDGLGALVPGLAAVIQDTRAHNFQGLQSEESKLTWSLNTQWDISDDVMSYIAVSTGFKGGGFDEAYGDSGESIRMVSFSSIGQLFDRHHIGDPANVVSTVAGNGADNMAFGEETVLSYELGAKMTLADGAANMNVAVFRSEFDNMQVSSQVGDAFRVGNAGKSISQGVEVDGRWRFTENLTLGGSLAYLDAYYDEFEGATCTAAQAESMSGSCAQDLGGETLLFSPDWSANLNLEHVTALGEALELRSSLDLNYADEFYSALDLDPNTKHDAVTKVNLRLALMSTDNAWSVALIGKNLTDKTTSVWNNDVALNAAGAYYGVMERPRTVAIQAKHNF